MDKDKLKRMSDAVRTGGKGTVRRKKKVIHRTNPTDDKRLQTILKRLGVNHIAGIEEVNMFMKNSQVMHFEKPKVQASFGANTYVISGTYVEKKVAELLPKIITQMGPESLDGLKRVAEQMQKLQLGTQTPHMEQIAEDEEDDLEVPDLVENFEEAAAET